MMPDPTAEKHTAAFKESTSVKENVGILIGQRTIQSSINKGKLNLLNRQLDGRNTILLLKFMR